MGSAQTEEWSRGGTKDAPLVSRECEVSVS